jgi:hypothetical protein
MVCWQGSRAKVFGQYLNAECCLPDSPLRDSAGDAFLYKFEVEADTPDEFVDKLGLHVVPKLVR